jgi:hypothetical protein
MKAKLRLSYPHDDVDGIGDGEGKFYRVETAVGSVEFGPGDMLDRETVLDLCARTDLRIVVVPVPPPSLYRRRGYIHG